MSGETPPIFSPMRTYPGIIYAHPSFQMLPMPMGPQSVLFWLLVGRTVLAQYLIAYVKDFLY